MAALVDAPGYRDLLLRLHGLRTLGVQLGLGRVRDALAALGSPEARLPAVQIAGTNGKGSTAAMTAAILADAGHRTGLFTSPHLASFTERFRLPDGRPVDPARLVEIDRRIEATGIPLTYFEVATVMAFVLFADECEVAVLETGLGGRLDAVTACRAVATAVTSIALDHTELLGPTLTDVAREKAAIARNGVPLLVGAMPAEAGAEIRRVAAAVGAPVVPVGADALPAAWSVGLAGGHQRGNAALAVALARQAAGALGRPLSDAAARAGLLGVAWPGRLERLPGGVRLDCAHNPEGAAALRRALDAEPGRRVLVASVVEGKDAAAMLAILAPAFDGVVVTASQSPRAIRPAALAALVPPGTPVALAEDPPAALQRARSIAGPGGEVVVAGSIFLVAEVRAALLHSPLDPLGVSDPMPAGPTGPGAEFAAASRPT